MTERLDFHGNVIPEGMHEYAFDVKLFAVVRIVAAGKTDAIETMKTVVDAMDPTEHWVAGFNQGAKGQQLRITEVSLSPDGDGENEEPFEIDGEFQ